MTRIVFKLISGYGEIREFTPGTASIIEVVIDGADDGIFKLGTVSKRMRGGVCRIDASHISDGDYTPTLIKDGSIITLERVRKMGNSLTRPPIDINLIERALLRIESLEGLVMELTRRLTAIEADVHAPLLFTKEN